MSSSCRAGSINTEYGVYRNDCCGDEIVLYPGAEIPNCKKHQDIITHWKFVGTDASRSRNANGDASAA
jgi:hypothetical protein